VQHIAELIQGYGVAIVFLLVMVSRAGLPIPAWPVLLVAGALTASRAALLPPLFAAAAAGSLVADLLWYAAGARWGRRVLGLLCRFTLSPDSCVRQTEGTFTRFGAATLLFAKFVPGYSYVAVALSGITGTGLATFLALDALGSGFYVAVPLVLGLIFHNAVADVIATLARLGEYGLVLIAAALAAYAAVRWIQRRAFVRRLRMDRITVDELANLIAEGRPPVIFDVRANEARQSGGIIPGAVAAHAGDIDEVLRQYPRDVEVVIYCACPNEASAAIAALHLKRAGYRRIRPLLGGIDAWTTAGHPLAAV
jgi:membrane protein DedA with SNARE-associated domain/rhodanese-related sulfurtransferase